MRIDPLLPEDCARVAELAALTGTGFDPAAELARKYARLWVARREPGEAPVGFVLVLDVADEAHLLDLVVEPSMRRRGVGRALVERVISETRRSGARVVLLEVRASNAAARALYGSLGFVECGVRPRYYSDKDEDAILMRLELASNPSPSARTP